MDTSCAACTNYPYNLQNMSFAREQDRFQSGINATANTVFRWRSVGSVRDPYGLSGSTCEFQCYEGLQSIGGFFFDSSRTFEMGQATGLFPISGTCSRCNSSACSVGNYRGVCQANVSSLSPAKARPTRLEHANWGWRWDIHGLRRRAAWRAGRHVLPRRTPFF